MSEMWEILVPTQRNDGRFNRTRFHKVWDEKVRAITGGLTIMPVAKGQWISDDGQLFAERMIPVRVIVEDETMMKQVIDATMKHYDDQLAICAYRISDKAIITKRSA